MALSISLISCGGEDEDLGTNNGTGANSGSENLGPNDWLISVDEVKDGGPGKDGIPSIDAPVFISAAEATYMLEDELIVGYKFGSEIRAYPHRIFNWHEIVNDDLGGRKVTITHCPLTGTSLGWERVYNEKETTFGVSGLLYNTNLMPYDRTTNSTWMQIGELCVNGELVGTKAETFQVIETEWKQWLAMYPDTKVMSLNTGFSRNYNLYPYGDYRTAPGLSFPVSVNDTRRPQKERVHGIISFEKVRLYLFDSFVTRSIIKDTFMSQDVIVIGSKEKNFIVSFNQKTINSTVLDFTVINDFNSPILLKDQLGNEWDVFGNAVSGPNLGEKLEPTNSFIGMFFSWAPFYGFPEIWGQ
ncbi:MAG: DUF3179 domain-containing protein [Cyclobacteriaceae bacterium]|nr:DUF3179 domain-containing protein [Cyclobacteriaceae bacterium]